MKKIVLICRSEKEAPAWLLYLIDNLFHECEIQIVYDPGLSSGKQSSPDRLKTSFIM